MTWTARRTFLIGLGAATAAACAPDARPQARAAGAAGYRWEQLTPQAAFPRGYNFPVHVTADQRFVALHPEGTFESADGRTWAKSALPVSGLNSAYLKYVVHDGAAYALGRHTGNYLGFTIDPAVQRTRDYKTWEMLGRSKTLPELVFYGAESFGGFIWLIGGYNRRGKESPAIWRSRDALAWERVTDAAPFGARANPHLVVFKDRLWLLAGGQIDGAMRGDVWSSADGLSWRKEADAISDPLPTGFSSIVYDGKIWLLGANRSGGFSSSSLVSADGKVWASAEAPWSPRGGIGPWVHGGALYITGGKYSHPKPGGAPGELEFIYSNDVWKMTKA